jgi:hypothetical protein
MKTALKNPSANCLRKFKGLQLTFQVVCPYWGSRQAKAVHSAPVSRRSSTLRGAQVHVEAEMSKPCRIVGTDTTLHRAIYSPLHHPSKRHARLKAARHTNCHTLGQAARQVMLIDTTWKVS